MFKILGNGRFIVGPVRLSYLKVYKPAFNAKRDAKTYSAVLLFDKVNTIETALANKLQTVANDLWESEFPKGKKCPNIVMDGDVPNEADKIPHPGQWFVRTYCKEEYPPILFVKNEDDLTVLVKESDGWTSGDCGNVKISLYTWTHDKKVGMSVGLHAIMFTDKGEPFGDVFDPDSVMAQFTDD